MRSLTVFNITEAKVHDKKFLKSFELISHNMAVFDEAIRVIRYRTTDLLHQFG